MSKVLVFFFYWIIKMISTATWFSCGVNFWCDMQCAISKWFVFNSTRFSIRFNSIQFISCVFFYSLQFQYISSYQLWFYVNHSNRIGRPLVQSMHCCIGRPKSQNLLYMLVLVFSCRETRVYQSTISFIKIYKRLWTLWHGAWTWTEMWWWIWLGEIN